MKKYNRKKKGNVNDTKENENLADDKDDGGESENKTITIILGVIAVLLLIQTFQIFFGSDDPPPLRPQPTGQQQTQPQQPAEPQIDFNQQQAQAGPVTDVAYSTMNHDFGQVSSGGSYTHTFELTNTGNETLQYTNVYGDPGLNIVRWPQQPIPPGGTGEIEVELRPDQPGPVSKVVHIDGNTNPGHVHLNVSANAN